MRLQACIGMGQKSFLPSVKEKFKLGTYTPRIDTQVPLFVFGCGSITLKTCVSNHKGFAVILWTGSDTLTLHQHPGFVAYLKQNEDRIFNVTFSHWCKTDLDHFGINYQHRLIIPVDVSGYQFESECEDKVYHYGNRKRQWYYGTTLLNRIELQWEHDSTAPEFIYTTYGEHREMELYELYKDAIIGVRLTEHDGIAGSVIEMGLMGRRSIYNDPQVPCAVTYMSNPYLEYDPMVTKRWCYQGNSLIQSVGQLILDTVHEHPDPDKLLAEEMKEFVYDDLAWLDTKFYTG